MAFVRTVRGDVDPSVLGYCLPHEHITWDSHGIRSAEHAWSMYRFKEEFEMLKDFADNGGGCIGEASFTRENGREVWTLKAMSEALGVHIIACTGQFPKNPANRAAELPDSATVEDITKFYVRDVEVGCDGTDIKAGWIKGSTSYCMMTEWEEKCLRAACRAARMTGCPVHTHTSNGTWILEQLEVVKEEGLPTEQFCEAHVDRNPDYYLHEKLMQSGSYMIYDGPGKAKYYPDSMRVELLKKFVAEGFGKKIMMCNDMGKKEYHKVYGGGPGLNWIKEKFLPRLLDEGFTQEQIDDFMIHNPARFYTFKAKTL